MTTAPIDRRANVDIDALLGRADDAEVRRRRERRLVDEANRANREARASGGAVRGEWLCAREGSPEIFQPETYRQLEEATAICGACSTRGECLLDGIKAHADGVYGGMLLRNGKATRRIYRPRSVFED